ncbi:hypothetical protein LO772_02525 [Yinghuangia sp. ASG 101]|uniref:hypothetical protein n=1 Tax=Yinghuangia sp. ASG 101 TaxID=2896848 RepID=UPI001E455EBA|nr:hypothetical protein [Yinghuangia sp. ASG 101]UGQ12511.1 hypothetical protein LO772_02525 [Yinghuangia sp. ASG 101]
MAAKPRSRRQEQIRAASELRAQGWSWARVAAEFRDRYNVNARAAQRMARGWSQREAAEAWNARWPEDPKTFKNFSAWELWPGATGHAPSLATLDRLARLYECAPGDLLADMPNYGAKSANSPHGGAAGSDGGAVSSMLVPALAEVLTGRVVGFGSVDVNYAELAEEVVMWAQGLPGGINRRELVQKIGATLAVAAAAPLLDIADPEGRARAAKAVDEPHRVDVAAIEQAEHGLKNFRMQSDILGPQAVLSAVLAQRKVIGDFAVHASSELRPRVLSLYAELSQLVGWELYDIGDYRGAAHYYDDARTAAHDAENAELVTYILSNMSQLATWQGKPRVGIDHAIAAQTWAGESHSAMAQAYAADVAARAFAAAGDKSRARAALDIERAAAAEARSGGEPVAAWWYFYDESYYWGIRSEVSRQLDDPADALYASAQALSFSDPANVRDHTHRVIDQAKAHIADSNVDAASQVITEAARLTTINRSPRLNRIIRDARADLTPWQRTKPVRRLDEALRDYNIGTLQA